MPSVGALVLTCNEEVNIQACLESISWCNEIVVVDSFSKDNTVEICRKYTDKIFPHAFKDFASQRNFGLDKITSDWVLVVDADERVTFELRDEIKQIINVETNVAGYKIPRRNYFLGKWIKHCGWYPDYTLRLFKNNSILFTGLVHEKVELDGNIKKIKNPFIHYTYRNINQFINKADHYTTLDAYEMHKNGKKFKISDVLVNPLWRFIRMYFIKQGFMDGIQGFILSILYFFYAFLKYIKLWEISKQPYNNSSL